MGEAVAIDVPPPRGTWVEDDDTDCERCASGHRVGNGRNGEKARTWLQCSNPQVIQIQRGSWSVGASIDSDKAWPICEGKEFTRNTPVSFDFAKNPPEPMSWSK